jgi:hypothetical protein
MSGLEPLDALRRRTAQVAPVRVQEPANTRLYEPKQYEHAARTVERALHGRVVIRGAGRPWDMHRQTNSKRYLSPDEPELQDSALQDWEVFVQNLPVRSGKHRHQGGLAIFILEGWGYSVFDGVRHDWQMGDLLMLPLTPGGLEHQHFNLAPFPTRWIAFIYRPFWEYTGSQILQMENSPAYDAYMKQRAEDGLAESEVAHDEV